MIWYSLFSVAELWNATGFHGNRQKTRIKKRISTMSGTLPDNALQLQDESNDEFRSTEELEGMYTYFLEGATDPIANIKEDDRHHCFIIFQQNDAGDSVCSMLHHLARAPI